MDWVEFKNGAKFRLIEAKNRYSIEQLQEDGTTLLFVFHTQPFTLQQKSGSKYYDAFYDYARGSWTGEELDSFGRYYKEFCQELISHRVTANELEEIAEKKKKASEEKAQSYYDNY